MPPRELILYPTHKCNHKCFFCRRQKQDYTPPWEKDMKLSTVKKALRLYPSIRGIGIAGFGEPLLWDKLGKVLNFLSTKDLFLSIITNGSLLEERISVLQSEIDTISISLNASAPQEHKRITQVNTFESVLGGIETCLSELDAQIGLSFVVYSDNFTKIEEYISIGEELGVDFIDLHNILPHAELSKNNLQSFKKKVLTEKHQEKIDSLKGKYSIVRSWPTLINDDPPGNCQSPFISLGVDAREAISGCRRVVPPNPEFGFLKEGVWECEHFQRLRRRMNSKELKIPCKYCFGAWSG